MRRRSTKLEVPTSSDGAAPARAKSRPHTNPKQRRDSIKLVNASSLSTSEVSAHPIALDQTESIAGSLAVACSCGCADVRRSRTEWYEWPLKPLFMAFRCHWCGMRFWRARVRYAPLVWLDSTVDAVSVLKENAIIRAILLITLTSAAGMFLGYALSKLNSGEPFF